MRWIALACATVLIASGTVVLVAPDLLDWVEAQPPPIDSEPLLSWQGGENERWFVVLVDFDDATSSGTGITTGTASSLLENEVVPYFSAAGDGSPPTFDIHPSVHRASLPSEGYGADTSRGRDTASDGTFLPSMLAEEVLAKVVPAKGWDAYDLNGDGTVDRFLILHTSKGQESGSGGSSRIWSHFTRLMDPMDVDSDTTAAHYTMATLRGGTDVVGTVVHEMLHQLGAADLYPVHDPAWAGTWHGLGDWDVMASGNWNGEGSWPALPTSATAMLTGLTEPQWVDLAFPVQREGACLGPTVELPSRASGGSSIAVNLTIHQSVHMEFVGGNAYDDRLPGRGVLVTIADSSMLDSSRNEVNVDPARPYLMVFEADNDNGLLTGRDDGTEGDLFQHNTTFGAEGRVLYDHTGVRVPWTAHVAVTDEGSSISFSAPSCGHGLSVEGTVHGLTALVGSSVPVTLVNTDAPCLLTFDLSYDLAGNIDIESMLVDVGAHEIDVRPLQDPSGDVVDRLEGTMGCGASNISVSLSVTFLNRTPIQATFESTIPLESRSQITVQVPSIGHGSSTYSVLVEGPLSRIATTDDVVRLDDDLTPIDVSIDPSGLLVVGMLVRGEVVLVDLDGTRTEVSVVLVAGDAVQNNVLGVERVSLIGALLVLLGLSLLLPSRTPRTPNKHDGDAISDEMGEFNHGQVGHVGWTTTEPFHPPQRP